MVDRDPRKDPRPHDIVLRQPEIKPPEPVLVTERRFLRYGVDLVYYIGPGGETHSNLNEFMAYVDKGVVIHAAD